MMSEPSGMQSAARVMLHDVSHQSQELIPYNSCKASLFLSIGRQVIRRKTSGGAALEEVVVEPQVWQARMRLQKYWSIQI